MKQVIVENENFQSLTELTACMYVWRWTSIHTYIRTNNHNGEICLRGRKNAILLSKKPFRVLHGITKKPYHIHTYIRTYVLSFPHSLIHSYVYIHTYILNIILFMHIKLLSFFICLDAYMGVCMRVCAVQTWFDLSWTIHTLLPLINICILSCNLL